MREVVQPDAQNLMRPSNRRSDPLPGQRHDQTVRRSPRHLCTDRVRAIGGKERPVDVVDQVADVGIGVVLDEHRRSFAALLTYAN